ncbi:LuxR C-terminal-related transcriptional regulator [Nonomuraea typhae]|uniref:LuxR C-terminal-related transcriptional regulator n=1 Tax=Nonomuraea typhae TaxID=2603600 RepID=A0ABW7YSK2_9ACTN|nr:sigma factor-like helix-turn-helix DNA-binding protein [Nonomuraea typhae]
MVIVLEGEPPPQRPKFSRRERAVLLAYTSGMTLQKAAHRIGISPATAKTYLQRVKAKYEQAGRPAYTKLELAERVREDEGRSE